jgi:hypothetical protein
MLSLLAKPSALLLLVALGAVIDGLAWLQTVSAFATGGKGKVPCRRHSRRRGERDDFRVSRYFTPLPLPFYVMTI